MNKIQSKDGTPIAYQRTGSGPALLLVHGGGPIDHARWDLDEVRKTLSEHCTVYAMDRRGRGQSGDTPVYSMEREVEDVAAVANSINEPVTVLGHSLGANFSLEAALMINKLHRLILYEPAFPIGDHKPDVEADLAGIRSLLEEGKNEEALITWLRDDAGLTQDQIETFQRELNWQEMVKNVKNIPREMQTVADYTFQASRFSQMNTPTLLLSGSESPRWFREVTEALNKALPDSLIVTFEGHGHRAMNTATDDFIREVITFIRETH
jgi:pimeloyl-ACP methyl ester carboxylesterase